MEILGGHHLPAPVLSGTLFLLGLAVGSFLNLALHRLPRGMSLVRPPSSCPACGGRIAWPDLVPLLGWLRLAGACRRCGARIPARYPLTELATGLLWGLEGWRLAGAWTRNGNGPGPATGAAELAFLALLVVAARVDWERGVIPDWLSLGGMAAAMAASPFLPGPHHAETWARSLAAAVAGAGVGLGAGFFLRRLGGLALGRHIEAAGRGDPAIDAALGLGDVKLMGFCGAFLGGWAVFTVLLVASAAGAQFGVWRKFATGDAGGKRGVEAWRARWRSGVPALPFGPFLALGAAAALFADGRFPYFEWWG